MGFMEISKALLNKTFTENGDVAFSSTGSSCLDYFGLIGGKRNELKGAAILFADALSEDVPTAVKLLFYTRDARKGIGERRLFRFLFNGLSQAYPTIAEPLLPFIPKYGRYDDFLCVFGTPLESQAIELIEDQLQKDLEAKKEGKPISLLAKWLPSINTSNGETRQYALALSKKLGMSPAEYRKTLSYLRKGLIVENNLREKDYEFDYAKVPSLAMQKYQKAFTRNDGSRFYHYLDDVRNGKEKMNTAVSDVVSFIVRLREEEKTSSFNKEYFETAWNEFVKGGSIKKKTLVVRDGSGSMLWGAGSTRPIDVADAMAMLTAARLQGSFKDKFVTFSDNPQFVDLSNEKTLCEKYHKLKRFNDYSSTDIHKVYQLILDVYQNPSFQKDDALDQILIISDMQFNMLPLADVNGGLKSTFQWFDEEFKKIGYARPEVVFWNVNSRNNTLPIGDNGAGVKLVSGSSKNIINMVSMTDSLDAKEFMMKTLETYQEVADALPKEVQNE